MTPSERGLMVIGTLLVLAGIVVLGLSRLPAAVDGSAVTGSSLGHHIGEVPAYGPIPGLATHPGPAIATIAAQLSPVAGPARLVAITRAPATPAAPAGSP